MERKIKSDGSRKTNSLSHFCESCNTKPCCNFSAPKPSTLKGKKLWKMHRLTPLVQHEKSPTAKSGIFNSMVRMRGLEPPLLSKPEPKSGASASFATSARVESSESVSYTHLRAHETGRNL